MATVPVRLSFWTLNMPDAAPGSVARRAAELGYQGVDLRCTRPDEHGRPSRGGVLAVTSSDTEIEEVRVAFAAAGVAIASLLCYRPRGAGGSSHTERGADWGWVRDDIARHAELARRVGAGHVRLVVGNPAEGSEWEQYLERLWQVTATSLADTPGVGAVYENHPGSASAAQLLETAARMGDPRIGVEFSPDHTVVMQEDTLGLADRYAAQIHQVCFSDRRVVAENLASFDGRYYHVRYEACPNGEGVVPAAGLFARLAAGGFAGHVSMKWEIRPGTVAEAPTFDEALADFPSFVRSHTPAAG